MKQQRRNAQTQKWVMCAILTAIVVILQLVCGAIPALNAIALALMPIVIGSSLYGPLVGGWLGFVFGMTVLLSGQAGAYYAINEIGTIVTVLAKGTLAGFLTGCVYKLCEKVSSYFAVIASAVICPVVNTGIYFLGCKLFFMDTIEEWAAAAKFESVGLFMIIGLAGINFIIEVTVNLTLASPLTLLLRIGKKTLK